MAQQDMNALPQETTRGHMAQFKTGWRERMHDSCSLRCHSGVSLLSLTSVVRGKTNVAPRGTCGRFCSFIPVRTYRLYYFLGLNRCMPVGLLPAKGEQVDSAFARSCSREMGPSESGDSASGTDFDRQTAGIRFESSTTVILPQIALQRFPP